jgi:YadA head domain repeat (2 copies)
MNFNFDTGLIDTIQTLDCTELPPLGGTAGVLTLMGTGAIMLLQGSVAQRPTGVAGMFRYNTDVNQLEYFDGTAWEQLTSTAGTVSSFQTSLSGLTPSTSTTGAITLAGTLGLPSGGTGANLATSNGSIIYNNGTTLANSTVGSLGQVLTSSGAGAPTWTTVSSTLSTNQIVQGDGTGAFTANGAAFQGSGTFSGVTLNGTVTSATDATTKAYVDSVTAGLSWKQVVEARTTADLGTVTYNNGSSGVGATLTNAGTQAVLALDGYTVQTGDRVLIANQAAPAQNGIYVVTDPGSVSTNWVLTRATDANTGAELEGAAVFVDKGTTYATTSFVQITPSPITVGTTNIDWTQFSGSGTYTAGSGLSLSGTQFSVKTDGTTTYVDGSNNVAVLSSSTASQVLISQGTGNTAAWGAITLNNTNAVSGSLGVGNGGTGTFTFTTDGVLYGNGTSAIQATAAGTTGQVLVGNTGGAPSWATLSSSAVTSFETTLAGLTPSSTTTGAVTLAGTLGATSGGTGSSTAPTTGQFLYSSGGTTYAPTTLSSIAVTDIAGTANEITASASIGAVTLSIPSTFIAPGSVEVTTTLQVDANTASSFIYSNASKQVATTAAPTNGQLLIGSTGANPVVANLTAGSNISISNGAGSITISGPQLYKESASAPTAPSASGTNSVAIGNGASASATNSFAVGSGSDATVWGGSVFANGNFATAGDAQAGLYVLRNITTNATGTDLFLDGTAATQRLIFTNNSCVTFDILITARRTDSTGGGAGYRFVGVVKKDGTAASNTLIGAVSKTVIGETNPPWDANLTANTTNGDLRVTVTGEASKTIRWVAVVRTTEVTN